MALNQTCAPLTPNPVVVLGMFRSGTSCVATCFTKLGYHFGEPDELFPADEFNPGGYFEIKELMLLNRRIVAAFGMNHYRIEEIPAHWADIPGNLALVGEVGDLLQRRLGGLPKWGWKEPQASVLMPLYRRLFSDRGIDPLYVVCVRNPLNVSASQRVHSPLPHIGERVIGLWLHYTLSALRETTGANRVVFQYDRFLANPAPFLRCAVDRIPSDRPSEEQIKAAIQAVRPDWRHSHQSEDGLAAWPELVAKTYRLATQCAEDAAGFQQGDYDAEIEARWQEWRQMREMVRTTSMPTGRFVASWKEEGRTKTAEAPMIPTGDWQTVTAPCQAAEGTVLVIDPYQTPCVIWIRSAVARELPLELKSGRGGVLTKVGDAYRLVVWGQDPLLARVPSGGIEEIKMELLIQSNPSSLAEVISALRGTLDRTCQKLQ